eukprot:Nitzschia sp. Nitz4//scaffold87_size112219//15007//17762//NITZ4_004062-RA/size112219-augustus-gene-0.58-mRNA-1//-1//CDS//3329559333//9477//frame0
MFKLALTLLTLAASAMGQTDYLTETPATLYEAEEISPQNLDFDAENNRFIAHAGWYNDHLIHYYKFRVYAPPTYPGVIGADSSVTDVPVQRVFIVTDSGDFTGMMGMPILEYHMQDGLNYSDFMSVTFVDAPDGYVAGTFKSVGDIMESGATMTNTDIVLNLPIVPTGAVLQHPTELGDAVAPIDPLVTYYRGVEVWTYLFEVTDESAATAFASTRTSSSSDFSIPVSSFGSASAVRSIPLWHVNQFERGVTEGENGGGPNPAGMKNVINLDRADFGYSPLWQLYWATEVPLNFNADDFSNIDQGTSANGFEFLIPPMWVNCPDIGMVGEEVNPLKAETYMTTVDTDMSDTFVIIGSDASIIMTGDVEVTLMADDGTMLSTVLSNFMGGYEFTVTKDEIPDGVSDLTVMIGGEVVRTIMVESDYLTETPATLYEAEEISPQNLDFDAENNRFIAHAGWYNDHLIHYYKFRVYAPPTYPGVIGADSSVTDVPVQRVFIVTDSGDFTGMMGMPILEYHMQDGLNYSDFMSVTFVDAPDGYVAGTFKSVGDIMESGATMTNTDIVLNLPIVPTGAVLQHPTELGDAVAPIDPLIVYYRGVEVWTYLFEVTDASAAAAFASTRTSSTSESRASDSDFAITVTTFGSASAVRSIPLWHVNQFERGVTEGENGGGPNPAGMKNVINLDRADFGYSPLWQLYWATEVPLNFNADDFSNIDQGTSANGFEFLIPPMWVNCPDIGMVGEEVNPLKAETYMTTVDTDESDWFVIIGSDAAVIMTGDVEVTLMADDGTELDTVLTNFMGGYEFELSKDDIPSGVSELSVVIGGETVRTIMVEGDSGSSSAGASLMGMSFFQMIAVGLATVMMWL